MTELPPAVAKFVADTQPFVRGVDEATDAGRKFGREAEKSALQARRMGLAAKEAGERAAKAGLIAKEAAEKAAKGMLKEEQAAQAAARAVRELERAEIAQSLAALASAEASEKAAKAHRHQADSLRGLGRDGQVAGGLLARGVQAGVSGAESALEGLSRMGPLVMAGIVAAVGLLPVAGVAAGALLTTGLGGALLGLGLAASKGSAKAKAAIEDLKKTAKSEASQMAEPFEDVWTRISQVGQRELRKFSPNIRKDLADLAPVVATFADQAGSSLHELQPAIDGTERAFAAILRTLGPQMPAIMRTLSQAIRDVTDEIERNPEQVAQLIQGLATLVEWGGKTIGFLIRMSQAMRDNAQATQYAFQVMAPATSILKALGVGSSQAAGQLNAVSGATAGAALGLQQVGGAGRGASAAARAHANAQRDLNAAMMSGKAEAGQLKAALDALTGKHRNAAEAEVAYKQAIADATRGLKEHGRGLNLNTQAGRDNMTNLIAIRDKTIDHLDAMKASKAGTAAVIRESAKARAEFIALATKITGSSAAARELANRLLGIPSKVKTDVMARTAQAKAEFEALRRKLLALKNKTITITAVTRGSGASPRNAGAGSTAREFHGATGGLLRGPGTGTSDSIPLWGSNGEYMVNARSTAKYLPDLERINADKYADGGMVGYASGGQVSHKGDVVVGGVYVSAAQWRSLGQQLGKDFLKTMSDGSASEIGSLDRRLEKTIARLFGGKRTDLDNKLIKYLDRNSAHLEALAKQRDSASKALGAAKDYASGVTSNARSFAGLTSLDGPMNAEGVRVGLGAKASQLKAFAKAISDLSKRGLSKGLIRQVIDAGPEQGLQLAQMLLSADRSTMSGINRAQADIDKVSTSLGRNSADLLYDAGKHAGEGFLTGLQASLKSLDKEMDKIAKKMAATLKKALHIKSPSRHPDILHAADMTMAGFAGGMVKGLPHLDKAGALMAARIARPRIRPALVAPLVAHRTAAPSGGDGGTVVNVKVTLDGRELRAGVQSETLRYGRNNGSDGNTRRR